MMIRMKLNHLIALAHTKKACGKNIMGNKLGSVLNIVFKRMNLLEMDVPKSTMRRHYCIIVLNYDGGVACLPVSNIHSLFIEKSFRKIYILLLRLRQFICYILSRMPYCTYIQELFKHNFLWEINSLKKKNKVSVLLSRSG